MPRRRADPATGAAQTVQRVLNETKPGLDAHDLRRQRYDRCYDIWRAPDKPREREGRPAWKPLLKVKYGMLKIDQATVAIAQGVPHARCTPRNEASVEKAKAMEQILGYYADISHLVDQQSPVDQQALVYGVSPAKTCWNYKEAERGMLVPKVDEQTGEVLWREGTARTVVADWPDMQAWDVYDTWWDPAAKSPDSAAYVILRAWPSKKELLAKAYNEETGLGTYRNLELLFASGSGAPRPATAQNQILDSEAIPYKDRFEVWECWYDDRLVVIGNRQVLLYDGPKPYWMPGKPVSISVARPDFFRMEGISETEVMDHVIQNLQAQDNLRLENHRMTVQRGFTYRDTIPDVKALVMQPHFLWAVGDHDDIRAVEVPPLPREAYEEHEVLLSLLDASTGLTPFATGQPGADQNTATGASLFTNSASRLLVYKSELISRRTWLRTFEQWAALTRQFLRSEVDVAIRGPGDAIDWRKVGPAEVFGEYDVRIESAEEQMNKQQRRADAVALLNALAPYAQAGQIDPKPLLKQVAEAFGFPHPEALFPAQGPPQFAAPGQQFPAGPTPFTLGNTNGQQQLAPQPQQATLMGNAR